jgi:hypothetical protein
MSGTISFTDAPDAACAGFRDASAGALSGVPFADAMWSNVECIDLVSEPGVFVIREATFVLTSEDGTIAGTGEGHASHPSALGHVYAWGTFNIVSGTGAYAGASGSGLFAADANLIVSSAQLELSGTLTKARLGGPRKNAPA